MDRALNEGESRFSLIRLGSSVLLQDINSTDALLQYGRYKYLTDFIMCQYNNVLIVLEFQNRAPQSNITSLSVAISSSSARSTVILSLLISPKRDQFKSEGVYPMSNLVLPEDLSKNAEMENGFPDVYSLQLTFGPKDIWTLYEFVPFSLAVTSQPLPCISIGVTRSRIFCQPRTNQRMRAACTITLPPLQTECTSPP